MIGMRNPGRNAQPDIQPDRPYRWQDQAVCAAETGGKGSTELPEQVQLGFCDRCTVRAECLAYALQRPTLIHEDIVWGGMTAAQLTAIYRRIMR